MTFLLIVEEFDIKKVFIFFFRNNIDTSCKKVMSATLFLFFTTSKKLLMILIVLISLTLMDRYFPNKYINKKKVSGFILPKVLIFFFYSFITLETLAINLLST